MSKKKALDYELSYVGPAFKEYVRISFLDKKNRIMMSSVDVVLNAKYLVKDEDWDLEMLQGFVRTR